MEIVVAIEELVPPQGLSGTRGRNRSTGLRQIDADDDRSAILAWLARYADSPTTLASYRKESERLLLWCLIERQRAMSDLTHEDLQAFQRFLADPQPAARWVMAPGMKPGRRDPGWRPFA